MIGVAGATLLAACAPRSEVGGSPASAAPPSASVTPAPPPVSAIGASAVVDELIARSNNERRTAGFAPLSRSLNLVHAAKIQAEQMAALNQLDHDLPGARYPTLGSRLVAVEYPMRAAGENIGQGYRSAAEAMAGWMSSPGHRANILSGKYTEVGAAVSRASSGEWYWVEVFGAR